MMNLLPLILPSLLIGLIFLIVIKSKIKKEFARNICRTIVGIFALSYTINSKIVLLNFLSFLMLILFFIPKNSILFKRLAEDKEKKFGKLTDPILYLLMVMLTIILFPLWIAGCCLINLSFADGMASFVGKKGKWKLPWNKNKTFEGSFTFLLVSFIGCYLFLTFLSPLSVDRIILFTLVVSLASSFVESMRIKLDDNVRVPLVTGFLFWILTILF